jgi:hypothetical protein
MLTKGRHGIMLHLGDKSISFSPQAIAGCVSA